MRIIFMGTPSFAIPTLEALIKYHEVVAVFTKPDTRKGRSKKLLASPVKTVALENQIEVYQPKSLKDLSLLDTILSYKADAIVVAAYGLILPSEILKASKYGSINVHASLLPKYRGAAPINWSIINGEAITGVTIMQMDVGLDTGDMLLKESLPIKPKTKASQLTNQLANLGAKLLIETLRLIKSDDIQPMAQNDEESTYAPMLKKQLGYISFDNSSKDIINLVYGIDNWPVVTVKLNEKRIKIHEISKVGLVIDEMVGEPTYDRENNTLYLKRVGKVSTVVFVDRQVMLVACKDGVLSIEELTPEGKSNMKINSYLAGNNVKVGDLIEEVS